MEWVDINLISIMILLDFGSCRLEKRDFEVFCFMLPLYQYENLVCHPSPVKILLDLINFIAVIKNPPSLSFESSHAFNVKWKFMSIASMSCLCHFHLLSYGSEVFQGKWKVYSNRRNTYKHKGIWVIWSIYVTYAHQITSTLNFMSSRIT